MEPTVSTESSPIVTSEAKQKLSIPAAIIIAGLMISAAIIFTGHKGVAPSAGAPAAPSVNIKDVKTDGEPFIGNVNAPAVAYFSDYQCPFCKKFDATILPEIKKNYVDAGKLKVVFKDFVFLGPDSDTAALFARAVWALYPGQYFAWREAMYNAQDEEGNVGFGNRATIEALTKTIAGIDQKKVSAAVDANKDAYQKLVEADYDEGSTLGITGTPSLIVDKTLLNGLYPLSNYTSAIAKVVK